MRNRGAKIVAGVLGVLLLGGVFAVARPILRYVFQSNTAAANEKVDGLRLEGTDTLVLTANMVRALGIQTAPVAEPRPVPALAPLPGTLAIDTDRLARVHSRFPGEVHLIGTATIREYDDLGNERTVERPIRFGDKVDKGQLLAVIWSKDLGEKKSELVEAVSRLRLEQTTAKRMEELYRKGATPERSLREAERAVEASLIAVARLERTLRSWRLTQEEIDKIKQEAETLHTEKKTRTPDEDLHWAKAEIRAPFDGTVLERNIAVGDIVDTTNDLFKIADLRRLSVWAYANEEDLPTLQRLMAEHKPLDWQITLRSDPNAQPISGVIQRIGDIIDPAQRTALVTGIIPNPDGNLRVGQFITARILLPPAPGEIEVPVGSLIDVGRDAWVFVQQGNEPQFRLGRVHVIRRLQNLAIVRNDGQGYATLRPGDKLVVAGGSELLTTLRELRGNDTLPSE